MKEIATLIEKLKAKIKPESSEDEIAEINGMIADLETIENNHNSVVTENAKFKDTIVNMVLKTGDGKAPGNASDGSNPKSIEECIAEEIQKGEK